MAKNKTTETVASVEDFINAVPDAQKKADCLRLIEIIEGQTNYPAKMWGPAIVGFGKYNYKYESGRTGDAPLVGFSPRANAISLYLASSFKERPALLEKFGKYRSAKACVYINKLQDIDETVLKELVTLSVAHIKTLYPDSN